MVSASDIIGLQGIATAKGTGTSAAAVLGASTPASHGTAESFLTLLQANAGMVQAGVPVPGATGPTQTATTTLTTTASPIALAATGENGVGASAAAPQSTLNAQHLLAQALAAPASKVTTQLTQQFESSGFAPSAAQAAATQIMSVIQGNVTAEPGNGAALTEGASLLVSLATGELTLDQSALPALSAATSIADLRAAMTPGAPVGDKGLSAAQGDDTLIARFVSAFGNPLAPADSEAPVAPVSMQSEGTPAALAPAQPMVPKPQTEEASPPASTASNGMAAPSQLAAASSPEQTEGGETATPNAPILPEHTQILSDFLAQIVGKPQPTPSTANVSSTSDGQATPVALSTPAADGAIPLTVLPQALTGIAEQVQSGELNLAQVQQAVVGLGYPTQADGIVAAIASHLGIAPEGAMTPPHSIAASPTPLTGEIGFTPAPAASAPAQPGAIGASGGINSTAPASTQAAASATPDIPSGNAPAMPAAQTAAASPAIPAAQGAVTSPATPAAPPPSAGAPLAPHAHAAATSPAAQMAAPVTADTPDPAQPLRPQAIAQAAPTTSQSPATSNTNPFGLPETAITASTAAVATAKPGTVTPTAAATAKKSATPSTGVTPAVAGASSGQSAQPANPAVPPVQIHPIADQAIQHDRAEPALQTPTADRPVMQPAFLGQGTATADTATTTPQSVPAGGDAAVRADAKAAATTLRLDAGARAGVVQDMSVAITRFAAQGVSRFQIQMNPAELGRVDVRMEMGAEGRVTAHVIAERPEALDILRQDSRALERALNDAGLKADSNSLNFSLKDQGEGARGNHDEDASANWTDDGVPGEDVALSVTRDQDSVETIPGLQIMGAGGIDVRI